MKISLLLVFLVILPVVIAQESDYNSYSNLTMRLNIDGNFSMIANGGKPTIDDIKAELTFITQNDILQKVNAKKYYSTPRSETAESTDRTVFTWESPRVGDYNFGLDAEITVKNAIVVIDEKVKFPLSEINQEYVQPTEFIDTNQEIANLAHSLADGEDDLYVVSAKVADWVEENIEYDLNTLTAEAVQKSSWVLRNKAGVCDELTNLFISMMRSLGVPARFVSGVAYTNIWDSWGPHGWAEVYFPDKGWVPFDVTYKQFGWIDPTHIKLKVSQDSGDATVRYTWTSHNVQIEGKEINLSAEIVGVGEKVSPISFSIRPLINNVGPGSYIPIEVEITSEKNYYFPTTFIVKKATELTERNVKTALLKPMETKKIFWITKIPTDIEENYIYRTLVEIEDKFHTNKSTTVTYSKNLEVISLEEAQGLIEVAEQIMNKSVSKDLKLDCKGSRYGFSYEEIKIRCDLENTGEENIENIETCYAKNCKMTNSLHPNEEKNITFMLNLEPGVQNLEFISKFNGDKASDIVSTNILENPDLRIVNIEYPESPDYNQDFNVSLTFSVEAPVKDINIIINKARVISIQELDTSKTAVVITKGKDFINSKEIAIEINFKDENNKEYKLKFNYPIQIKNIPWYIKVLVFFKLT